MKKTTSIGGQAVMEGVMMKSAHNMALAVRKTDGTIAVQKNKLSPWTEKKKVYSLPVIRGAVTLADTLTQSVKVLTGAVDLAGYDEEEPTKFEKWLAKKTGKSAMDVAMPIAIVLAVLLCVVLYVITPSLIGQLLAKVIKSGFVVNLLEGIVRMAILVGYLMLVSRMSDIKRMLAYHGAEHKTIACYESGLDLTPENAREMSRLHPRCGTSYLFLVMLVSIFIFICFGAFQHYWIKLLTRLLMIPIVAGVSYELLKALAKDDGKLAGWIKAPGLKMQYLTTNEPDDGMLEVAIAAFNAVREMDEEDERAEAAEAVPCDAPASDSDQPAAEAAETEGEEADQADVTDVSADEAPQADEATADVAGNENETEDFPLGTLSEDPLEKDEEIILPEDMDLDI